MKIDPCLLIHKDGEDKLGSFFLALGVIYNDLKGIILLEQMLIDAYEQPDEDEVTVQAGNFGGVMIQTQKLIASVISEFFSFLSKNKKIISTRDFHEIIIRLGKSDQLLWRQMIDAANGRFANVSDLLKSITQIRSNISFHYDHSGKILLRGYKSRFFSEVKDCRSEYAYYSIGKTMGEIRFFFSDAAAEESMHVMAGKNLGENSRNNASLIKYQKQVLETVIVMSTSMASLISNFIKHRRNCPR